MPSKNSGGRFVHVSWSKKCKEEFSWYHRCTWRAVRPTSIPFRRRTTRVHYFAPRTEWVTVTCGSGTPLLVRTSRVNLHQSSPCWHTHARIRRKTVFQMPSRGSAVAQVARYGAVAKKVFPTLWSELISVDELLFIGTIMTYKDIASISKLEQMIFRVHTRGS
jgi:hypothetical protein